MGNVEDEVRVEARLGAALVLGLLSALLIGLWPGWPTARDWVAGSVDVKTVLPVLVVIIGWPIAHGLNLKREIAAARRQTRIEVLGRAFLALHGAIGRSRTEEQMQAIERAVGEIQLYGTVRQLLLMDEIVLGLMKPDNPVDVREILVDLQREVRGELELTTPTDRGVAWLALNRPTPTARKVKISARR